MTINEMLYLFAVGLAGLAVVGGMFGIVVALTAKCQMRRRRLGLRRPDWGSAPEWARVAVCPYGHEWSWIEFEPHQNKGNPGRVQLVRRFLDLPAASTVERRPHGE